MTTRTAGRVIVAAAAGWIACDDGGDGRGPCGDFNWRSETTDEIVCPYTPDCACPVEDVCCVAVEGDHLGGASCAPLGDCADMAFECDGPEDCGEGAACCADVAPGGGSSCGAAAECFDIDEVVMCRDDGDCALGEDCVPADPGTYFEGVAGYCDL